MNKKLYMAIIFILFLISCVACSSQKEAPVPTATVATSTPGGLTVLPDDSPSTDDVFEWSDSSPETEFSTASPVASETPTLPPAATATPNVPPSSAQTSTPSSGVSVEEDDQSGFGGFIPAI